MERHDGDCREGCDYQKEVQTVSVELRWTLQIGVSILICTLQMGSHEGERWGRMAYIFTESQLVRRAIPEVRKERGAERRGEEHSHQEFRIRWAEGKPSMRPPQTLGQAESLTLVLCN